MLGGEQIALKRGFLLDLLWPPACFGCGQSGSWWCSNCQTALVVNWRWRRLQLPQPSALTAVFYCADYQQLLVNRLLKQTKYGRLTITGQILAINFANFIQRTLAQQAWFKDLAVTAVPLSRQRHNWRGFNQAKLLAQASAHLNGQLLLDNWRRQNRPQQARLTKTARLINLNDSFCWRGRLANENIVIIDDVATTGTTLIQAANCLKQAGAGQIFGLVLAH
jgi:ComF family protein